MSVFYTYLIVSFNVFQVPQKVSREAVRADATAASAVAPCKKKVLFCLHRAAPVCA